ncbi:helix-turn-helix domain-containing protein [Lacrimispora indolis]|nr:helix-turn-helix domain-containing protein [Lacrimispora celerecrescens]
MKIYEIAQAVGYNDSAHFIRAFKEVTGKSPGDYKASS